MKSKFITTIFITERNAKRSFTISKAFLNFCILIFIGIIALSILGFIRVIQKDELYIELHELRKFKNKATHIINDLDASDLLGNTPSFEETLKKYFEEFQTTIPLTAPVTGYVTQGISMETEGKHYGIDIAAKADDLIRAPADGLVIFSGIYENIGKAIILAHDKGFYTVFGHNDTNLVTNWQWINYGDPIARVGGSGETEGPHLHLEIWKNDQVLDPCQFIKEYKNKDVSIK